MNNLKKYLILLLGLFLFTGLTACSSDEERYNEGDIVVGNDWRVTGVVRDAGEIIRDGEKTAVLVCVDSEGAYFYYDDEVQIIYDGVIYPVTVENSAWDVFKGISFDDLNDDGNSDVTVYLDDNGNEYEIIWIWDVNKGYILADDWSVIDDESTFYGYWEYEDGRMIEINDNGMWNLFEGDEVLDFGKYEYSDGCLYLMTADGSSGGGMLYFDDSRNLTDGLYFLTYSEIN